MKTSTPAVANLSRWAALVAPLLAVALIVLYGLEVPGISATFAQRLALSRGILFLSATAIAFAALWKWQATRRLLHEFWYGIAHPVNLAIYRIALFATIAIDPDIDYDRGRVLFFSRLPHELRIDLPLMAWISQHVPINEALASCGVTLLKVFSILALVGLFTRTSAALAAIIGVYVLGIPQLFGQTNHYHHMVWFAAILATSRCGDYLSVDALVSALRHPHSHLRPPEPSRAYAMPLRFVWLLMGLIYFFPGFWKYWHSGLDWAFSDNFKHQLYVKWMQLGGWTPAFRIDQHPLLCHLGALGAIVFELTFILFIFLPRLRWVPAAWGLMFHNSTYLLMRIAFITLQTSYVSLFNWHGIFRRLGRWIFRRPMVVAYDGRCMPCLRLVAAVQTFDLLGQVEYLEVTGHQAIAQHLAGATPCMTSGIRATAGERTCTGFAAARAIAWRVPLLWPILPLLYLWPLTAVGNRLIGSAAPSTRPEPAAGAPAALAAPRSLRIGGVMAMGIFLLVGNLAFGLMEERRGWPLTCYPPFSHILGPQTHGFRMVALDSAGRPIPWRERDLVEEFSWARYGSMLRLIRQRNDPRQFNAFYRVALQFDPTLASASRVQFYDELLWVDPERQEENPVERKLFHETLPPPSLASR